MCTVYLYLLHHLSIHSHLWAARHLLAKLIPRNSGVIASFAHLQVVVQAHADVAVDAGDLQLDLPLRTGLLNPILQDVQELLGPPSF